VNRSMDRMGMTSALLKECCREGVAEWKDPDLGHSLRRNDSSSVISRSAQDLPKLMMAVPTWGAGYSTTVMQKNR
jgi:hypothetical protein